MFLCCVCLTVLLAVLGGCSGRRYFGGLVLELILWCCVSVGFVSYHRVPFLLIPEIRPTTRDAASTAWVDFIKRPRRLAPSRILPRWLPKPSSRAAEQSRPLTPWQPALVSSRKGSAPCSLRTSRPGHTSARCGCRNKPRSTAFCCFHGFTLLSVRNGKLAPRERRPPHRTWTWKRLSR